MKFYYVQASEGRGVLVRSGCEACNTVTLCATLYHCNTGVGVKPVICTLTRTWPVPTTTSNPPVTVSMPRKKLLKGFARALAAMSVALDSSLCRIEINQYYQYYQTKEKVKDKLNVIVIWEEWVGIVRFPNPLSEAGKLSRSRLVRKTVDNV